MAPLDSLDSKPLPTPEKRDLPPPPTSPSAVAPPSPTPRLDLLPPFGSLDSGLTVPSASSTPNTPPPTSAPPSPSLDSKPKKTTNPLIDLIESEKTYVEQLTGIIRKVAAAWSRSNLPPPELDVMFRCVEGVYKANRSFLSKLNDIGPSPSSPKAVGDVLMRWIDDLEAPYTTYCSKYCTGFDAWDPVQSNPKLSAVLSTFNEANPPPSPDQPWTLDDLFLLPKIRLKYYKRLYGRLLKGTAPGRSDHKLLSSAVNTLDKLLSSLQSRETIGVHSSLLAQDEQEVVVNNNVNLGDDLQRRSPAASSDYQHTPEGGSAHTSLHSIGELQQAPGASGSRTALVSISDLEHRLATDRTLDIFTMTPKAVRLQMSPPNLPFYRDLRIEADVTISFVPMSTGVEVIHPEGHIFLLTDLFLICERMSPEEQAQGGPDRADMWLCYPPLAGKVLRISEAPGQDTDLHVSIMKKETLTLHFDSVQRRDAVISEFIECIDFASAMQPNPLIRPLPSPPPPNGLPPGAMPPASASVPFGYAADSAPGGPPNGRGQHIPSPPPNSRLVQGMANMSLGPDGQLQQGPHRVAPGQEQPPFASRTSRQFPGPVGPGQIMNINMGPPPPPPHPPGYNPNSNIPHAQPQFQQRQPQGPPHYSDMPPIAPLRPVLPPPPPPHDPQYRGVPPITFSSHSFGSHEQLNQMHPPPNHLRPRLILPSTRVKSVLDPNFGSEEPSPPPSPVEESAATGPVTSRLFAQMKCKVFLQQSHAQWKNLGSAKLKLYLQHPTNVKQLVVESDNREKTILISTIVLTDGVERVGKTGVAIELSDKGARTGIVYMIQLRNETSAGGLFDSLLAGSDRSKKS